jgi:hypothetical protein
MYRRPSRGPFLCDSSSVTLLPVTGAAVAPLPLLLLLPLPRTAVVALVARTAGVTETDTPSSGRVSSRCCASLSPAVTPAVAAAAVTRLTATLPTVLLGLLLLLLRLLALLVLLMLL